MTRRACPRLAELSAFAAGEPVAGVASHAASCIVCKRRLDAVRRALQANVRAASVAAFAEEIDALVADLLKIPAQRRRARASEECYTRPAIAQRFCELAVGEWERDLNVALDHILITRRSFRV